MNERMNEWSIYHLDSFASHGKPTGAPNVDDRGVSRSGTWLVGTSPGGDDFIRGGDGRFCCSSGRVDHVEDEQDPGFETQSLEGFHESKSPLAFRDGND